VEELITTVILVSLTFALDLKDALAHESTKPAYYEVEQSDNLPQEKSLARHHLHRSGGTGLAGDGIFHRVILAYSKERVWRRVNRKMAE
jgi:hypothetical protein